MLQNKAEEKQGPFLRLRFVLRAPSPAASCPRLGPRSSVGCPGSRPRKEESINQSSPLCSPPHLHELRIHAACQAKGEPVLAELRAVGALGNFPDWRASSSLDAKAAQRSLEAVQCQDPHSCCGTIDSCCMISWRSVPSVPHSYETLNLNVSISLLLVEPLQPEPGCGMEARCGVYRCVPTAFGVLSPRGAVRGRPCADLPARQGQAGQGLAMGSAARILSRLPLRTKLRHLSLLQDLQAVHGHGLRRRAILLSKISQGSVTATAASEGFTSFWALKRKIPASQCN